MADLSLGIKAAKTAVGQTAPEATKQQIVVHPFRSGDLNADARSSNQHKDESRTIMLEEDSRILRYLRDLPEFGYWPNNNIDPKFFEIDVGYFRGAMTNVLTRVLFDRYNSRSAVRPFKINNELTHIVPVVVDMCMSALYKKLRSVNRSCGVYASRYLSSPSYSKATELPLPFALAIQEFGHFTTHSLQKNYLMIPTYPEITRDEGRASDRHPGAYYHSYIPTLKRIGIEMKSVDYNVKSGSPWWTFKVLNLEKTTDLVCTLPRSHYSDLDAILRSVFCFADPASSECKDIIKLPAGTGDYGTLMHCMEPGFNARSFFALIDSTED
ncbi:hypothetical protein L1887_08868 [Cichorium endivia]|nr:hypothetical protein L1887_08868 [Cichorium endivia]